MAYPVWDSPQSNHMKCFLLHAIMSGEDGFRDVVPLIIGQYINLAKYQENHVKLEKLYSLRGGQPGEIVALLGQRYFTHEELLAEMLDVRLLDDSTTTYKHLLELMIDLYKAVRRESATFLTCRDKLMTISIRFKYADIIWLHIHTLSCLDRPNVRIIADTGITDILNDYLQKIRAPEFYLLTSTRRYELRTASLFRCVVSLLLRQARYREAASACHYVFLFAGIQNPWFHLRDIERDLSREYNEMLLHFNTMAEDNSHHTLTSAK